MNAPTSPVAPLREITKSSAGRSERILRIEVVSPAALNRLLAAAQFVAADFGNCHIGSIDPEGPGLHSLEELGAVVEEIWKAHGEAA